MMRHLQQLALAAAILGLAPLSAQAQPLPHPAQAATPDEQALAAELMALLQQAGPDPTTVDLARLDDLLARAERRTPFRGTVQFARVAPLYRLHRMEEAMRAAEESIELLPGFGLPHLAAFHVALFLDRPIEAGQHLLQGGRISPELLVRTESYYVGGLAYRLEGLGEHRLLAALGDMLIAAGWTGTDPALRSSMARFAVEEKVERGDLAGARALVEQLTMPSDVRRLLMQNAYRPLWNDLDRWAGAGQRRLWQAHLTDLRNRWAESGDREAGLAYARGLREAGLMEAVIRDFLPLFGDGLDRARDYRLLWAVVDMGHALSQTGRWRELDEVYDRAEAAWPLGSEANAINIAANRAYFDLQRGDAETALRRMRAAHSDGERRPGEVGATTTAISFANQICALAALGREAEARELLPRARSGAAGPEVVVGALLCLDEHDAARDLLIAGLDDPARRPQVLSYVQSAPTRPADSDWGRASFERHRRLAADPLLRAAVARHGRILPPTDPGPAPEPVGTAAR